MYWHAIFDTTIISGLKAPPRIRSKRLEEGNELLYFFEVIRQLCAHPAPINDDTWDEKVTSGRGKTLEQFVYDFEATAQRAHPGTDPLIKETRHKFSTKLTLCLKVALSKHARVQPGATIFGKRQLAPACMACGTAFSETFRRHHCRSCGLSVCDEHSKNTAALPHLELFDAIIAKTLALEPSDCFLLCGNK